MKWKDIKLLTLKKIDPSINSLMVTKNTKDYINSMVGPANRGLQSLATAGKYIVKHCQIVNPEVKNLLDDTMKTFQKEKEPLSFIGEGSAYYFEICGEGQVTVSVDGVKIKTINHADTNGFTAYKGIVANPNLKPLEVKFGGQYSYQIRNIAVYDNSFKSDSDVWDFTENKRYQMKKLFNDFFYPAEVNAGIWEGDSTFVVDGLKAGTYEIDYYAYPQDITDQTPDEEELILDPEVANLLPVYMASELVEDDDSSIAYYFRQQFEEAKARLKPNSSNTSPAYIDELGWD